ncbi:MAG: heat-inducible protein [Chlorobi bacterium OLB5]|nr:MAG: heat-inducible protein [Chlorobi bacterium OLB5]
MKTINILTFVSVLFFVFIFSGCSGSKVKTAKAKLDGVEWKLESLNGKSVSLNSGSKITLAFDITGRFSGTAVCNKYFGEYKQGDETLSFLDIGSTKMMCDDNVDESVYFTMLKKRRYLYNVCRKAYAYWKRQCNSCL